MHREFATRDRATAGCAAGGNMQKRNHEALAGLEFVLSVDYCTRLTRRLLAAPASSDLQPLACPAGRDRFYVIGLEPALRPEGSRVRGQRRLSRASAAEHVSR